MRKILQTIDKVHEEEEFRPDQQINVLIVGGGCLLPLINKKFQAKTVVLTLGEALQIEIKDYLQERF